MPYEGFPRSVSWDVGHIHQEVSPGKLWEERWDRSRTGGRHSAVEGGFDSMLQGTVKEWRAPSELSQSEVRVLEDLLPCTRCYHCQQAKWVPASSLRTVPHTCRLSGEKVHQEATHTEIVRGSWVCGVWVESGWYCTEWLTPTVVLSSCIKPRFCNLLKWNLLLSPLYRCGS